MARFISLSVSVWAFHASDSNFVFEELFKQDLSNAELKLSTQNALKMGCFGSVHGTVEQKLDK